MTVSVVSLESARFFIKKYINSEIVSDYIISSVLYVPNLRKNLFSVGACTKKSCKALFDENKVELMKDNQVCIQGLKQDSRMYKWLFRVVSSQQANSVSNNLQLWHERARHGNKEALQYMVNNAAVNGLKL